MKDGETLVAWLGRLADECERDHHAALPAPWVWTNNGRFLRSHGVSGPLEHRNNGLDRGVLEHMNSQWTVATGDREAIALGRNRLPELVTALREAARCVDCLERLAIQANVQYAESRDHVATLTRERDDLVTVARQHDARVADLEAALAASRGATLLDALDRPLIDDHAYLSAGDAAGASDDVAYHGCYLCGRSRKEHSR